MPIEWPGFRLTTLGECPTGKCLILASGSGSLKAQWSVIIGTTMQPGRMHKNCKSWATLLSSFNLIPSKMPIKNGWWDAVATPAAFWLHYTFSSVYSQRVQEFQSPFVPQMLSNAIVLSAHSDYSILSYVPCPWAQFSGRCCSICFPQKCRVCLHE